MKLFLITIACAWPLLLRAAETGNEAPQEPATALEGMDSAKTAEELKAGLLFAQDWQEFEWKGNKLLIALCVLPTFGESYIDVHGYLYNRSFKEWRRFCLVKTRNVGRAEIGLDEENEELYLLAKANTPMKGKRVFRYSLHLLSDDRAAVRGPVEGANAQAADGPTGEPANAGEPKP